MLINRGPVLTNTVGSKNEEPRFPEKSWDESWFPGPGPVGLGNQAIHTALYPGNQESPQDFSGNLGYWFLVPAVSINTGPVLTRAQTRGTKIHPKTFLRLLVLGSC